MEISSACLGSTKGRKVVSRYCPPIEFCRLFNCIATYETRATLLLLKPKRRMAGCGGSMISTDDTMKRGTESGLCV